MSKQLVISTTSWKALIESLHGNAKHGYNKLESLKQVDGYFTAVLCQGFDEKYVDRLKVVTGTETDVEEYVDFLTHKPTMKLSIEPLTEKVVKEIKDAIVEYATSETAATIKIKRTNREKK